MRHGELRIGGADEEETVGAQGLALLDTAGTRLRLAAGAADTKLLILGGEPIDEPIAHQGPFVMNTREEIL